MATGVSWGSISTSGSNINYAITWEGFGCTGTRELIFRLFDINRNAVVTSILINSGLNTTGTYNGTFSSIYQGVFTIFAIFKCDGTLASIYESPEHVHGSTIPPPSPSEDPPPVTNDPNSPSSGGICIPTTGAVSMGDLNVIFNRVRTLSNTLLSGTSNPSVSPSLFGISFLPLTGNPSKTTPNAISEFRGYCHVEPIINPNLYYQLNSDVFGTGSLVLDYLDINEVSQTLTINHFDGNASQQSSGNITIMAGTIVTINVNNSSFIISETRLQALKNGGSVYDSGFTTSNSLTYNLFLSTGDTSAQVYGVVNGNNPFG
jgi:hypothetical protein